MVLCIGMMYWYDVIVLCEWCCVDGVVYWYDVMVLCGRCYADGVVYWYDVIVITQALMLYVDITPIRAII